MFCEKCGNMLPEGSRFCMNCGAKAVTEETVQNAADQEAAVSADTPVIETEPEAVEKETMEIPDEKPAEVKYEIPVADPVRETKVQPAVAQQTVSQSIPEQTRARTSAETPQAKPVQPVIAQNFKNPTAAQNIQNPAAPQNIQQPVPPQDFRQPAASFTQAEVDLKPEKIKPLQTWKFVGMLIITGIPVINLIMILIWSFSGGFNKNTRSYARATLILWIIGLVLLIITAIVNWALIQYIWSSLTSLPVEFTPVY